jgi:hypothetical protein
MLSFEDCSMAMSSFSKMLGPIMALSPKTPRDSDAASQAGSHRHRRMFLLAEGKIPGDGADFNFSCGFGSSEHASWSVVVTDQL